MKYVRPLLFALPLCFAAAGCVQSHRYPPVVYTPVPAPTVVTTPAVVAPPAATSETTVPRVYPDGTVAPAPVVTPPGVSMSDLTIANNVRDVLKGQGALAGISKNVEATVQNGVVTLRGVVATDTDRQEIADRIARLPGVNRIDNELTVELR